MSEDEAISVLDSLVQAEGVVVELRFWVDTLEVLDRLAHDDIAYARNLVERLKDARQGSSTSGRGRGSRPILPRSIEDTLRQIVANAGADAAVVPADVKKGKGTYGYNAAAGVYGDMGT